MTSKELADLDKRIDILQDKILKTKREYEAMIDELAALIEQRNPEKKEERIKDRLFKAYTRSNKEIDFIIDFIENAPDEDDYWNY